jgi:hypothetical protein
MWPHFLNLVHESWQAFLQAEGTTGLGWIGDKVVLPCGAFLFAVVAIWKIQGGEAVKDHKKRTFGLAFAASVLVFAIWHGSVFLWTGIKTVYGDHRDTTGRWRAVVNEKDQLKHGLSDRDTTITNLKNQLELKPSVMVVTKVANNTSSNSTEQPHCWLSEIEGGPVTQGSLSSDIAVMFCNVRVEAPWCATASFDKDTFSGGAAFTSNYVIAGGGPGKEGKMFTQCISSPSIPAYHIVTLTVYGTEKYPPRLLSGKFGSQ